MPKGDSNIPNNDALTDINAQPNAVSPIEPANVAQTGSVSTVGNMSSDPAGMDSTKSTSTEPKAQEEDELEEDEEDELEETEPQVIREVIIKEKRVGGGGCFSFFKNLACFLFLLILALIVAGVAIVVFKPRFIVEPLKNFINGPYQSGASSENETPATIEDYVQSATIGDEGDVTFQITETQIASLVKSRTENDLNIKADIEDERLIILTDISNTGNPLWVVTELTDSGDKLELTHLGFGRLNTPGALRNFVKDQLFKVFGNFSDDLKVQSSEELANSLLNNFLDEEVQITEVNFEKDVILVTVSL